MSRRCLLGVCVGLGLALLAGPQPARAQYLGKSVSDWARGLQSNDPAVRRSAAFALGKTGKDANSYMQQLLRRVQTDKNAGVREAVATAIGEVCKGNRGAVEDGKVVRVLVQVLGSDRSALVKRSAAVSLGVIGRDAAAAQAALETATRDKEASVRQNAAWALGELKTDSVAALRQALGDRDPVVIRDAAKALGHLGKKAHAALSELLVACQNADTETKKAALVTLVGVVGPDDKAANGPISRALADRDNEVRYNAALAMGNIGGEGAAPAVPVLVEALLQKGNPGLQRQAAAVLKNIGPAAKLALNPLRKILQDRSDPDLQMNAAVALGGLDEAAEPAYQDLVRVVADPNQKEDVRYQAAVSLSRIGAALVKAGKTAVPRGAAPTLIAVVKNTKNPPEVRLRSLWALRVLQQGLADFPELFDALERIVAEPKAHESRMLRYDAAFLLGVFKRAKVSEKAMDVLNEFLHDDTVLIYAGSEAKGSGTSEQGTGTGTVKDVGKGDGRKMAAQALRYIVGKNGDGANRVRNRKDIVNQLQALRNSPDPDLRELIAAVLKSLDR